MEKSFQLSEEAFDALSEVGNVGVGNAATAISKMLDKKVGIDIPETKFIPLEKFAYEIAGPEKIVVSVYLEVTGDLKGECLFIFPRQGAMELVDLLMGKTPGETKMFEEMEESAFKEMSNIFTGAYLNALAQMLSLKLFPGIPHVAVDMAQALADFVLIKLARTADSILCVKTAIDIEGHNINGQFIIMFEIDSYKRMIEELHNKYGV